LRHIERAGLLVFLVDSSRPDPIADFETLVKEISSYNPDILKKKQLLVFNKTDLVAKKFQLEKFKISTYYVSALTGEGVEIFVKGLKELLSV
jgi:GTPase